MYSKNKFIVTFWGRDFENPEIKLHIAYNTAIDTVVGNIFLDANTGKVYKGITVHYVDTIIEDFGIRYIFECVYTQVPVTYFEDLKDTLAFDGAPNLVLKEVSE